MALFGWFKGDKEKEPKPDDFREKRRDNRVDLEGGGRISASVLKPEAGDKGSTVAVSVTNIGLSGCRLIVADPQAVLDVAPGQVLIATLMVEGFPIPLQIQIAWNIKGRELGVRFKPPFPAELSRLEKFLEPRFLGRSLREIDPSILQKELDKGLRWFQGANDTNLFSWQDPQSGQVRQQQLVFLEKVVEWSRPGSVRTGRIQQEKPSEQGLAWSRSDIIDFASIVDREIVRSARALLESSRIDGRIRKKFLEELPE